MNDHVRVKVPKAKNSKENINVISKANFLFDGKPAQIKEGLRDKFGNDYYDIVIPDSIQRVTVPFVIKINLKEIKKGERAIYQQTIT